MRWGNWNSWKKEQHYFFLGCVLTLLAGPVLAYVENPQSQAFIDTMVKKHGFDRVYMEAVIGAAERKQPILDAIAKPAEKTLTWGEYRDIFITQTRIDQGREFLVDQQATLARAEKTFGVPRQIIAAILGVETRYGRHTGGYRVVDALATLSFDYPPRSKFFTQQLEEFFLLVREQGFDATTVMGSYAGAMGYGQFIPSSYRGYAVDFDGDKVADIINNPVDAIGSVANYFSKHGWRSGEQVVVAAKTTATVATDMMNPSGRPALTIAELKPKGLVPVTAIAPDTKVIPLLLDGKAGPEYWLGFDNFYVITRYNHSHMYAMAVYQLSQALIEPQQ